MNKPVTTAFSHPAKAFCWSMQGICAAFKYEVAFRQEVFLFVLLCPLGFVLGTTVVERVLLVSPLFLVLIVEMLNSALEATVDRISDKKHILSGRAKDMGSAAVLIAMLNAIVIWILVLFDIYY